MERFYSRLPDMECLAGDTIDTFTVHVSGINLSGCTMRLILEDQKALGNAVVYKPCEPVEGGFQVQLTSTNTQELQGVYNLHFCLTDANGLQYRKLAGVLHVRHAAQGV